MEIHLWKEFLEPYELTVRELVTRFRQIKKGYRIRGEYCPIEDVSGRVKSVPSILAKAQRKGIPIERVGEEMNDIAGIRIICQFVEDIPLVTALIRDQLEMEILDERDYVTRMKDSGYRSYHMIASYDAHTLDGIKKVRAEIQIRTLGMDFWATIEHGLQYKYNSGIPEHIFDKLISSAKAIEDLDGELSAVRNDIMDAQNSMIMYNEMISEILSTIENLYRIANVREVEKIQNEFYRIYETGDTEQMRRFGRELDMIAEGYRAQSVETDEKKI